MRRVKRFSANLGEDLHRDHEKTEVAGWGG
jgi:hypothetical protein